MSLYTFNTRRFAASEQTGLTLVDIVSHEGVLYGLTATGLLKFTGTTDSTAAVVPRVKTGHLNFGSSTKKNISYVYLTGKFPSDSQVKLTDVSTGTDVTRTYTVDRTAADQDTGRAKCARGVKSTHWALEFTAPTGGEVQLDFQEAVVGNYSRRL